MAMVLVGLAALILILALVRSAPARAHVKNVAKRVTKHPGWTAAIVVVIVAAVYVGPDVAISLGLYQPSQHVTIDGGCARATAEAFGTHWLGWEPASMIPRPPTGPWTWSSTGVIRRVSQGEAVFSPDGDGAQIDFRSNPGGFEVASCPLQ